MKNFEEFIDKPSTEYSTSKVVFKEHAEYRQKIRMIVGIILLLSAIIFLVSVLKLISGLLGVFSIILYSLLMSWFLYSMHMNERKILLLKGMKISKNRFISHKNQIFGMRVNYAVSQINSIDIPKIKEYLKLTEIKLNNINQYSGLEKIIGFVGITTGAFIVNVLSDYNNVIEAFGFLVAINIAFAMLGGIWYSLLKPSLQNKKDLYKNAYYFYSEVLIQLEEKNKKDGIKYFDNKIGF